MRIVVKQYRENLVSFLREYHRNWVITITYQTSSNLARLSTRLTSEVYLSVQSTDGRRSRSVCRGLGSIYGRDPVHIALPLANALVSRFPVQASAKSSEIRETSRSPGLLLEAGNCRKLDGNLTITVDSTQRIADYPRSEKMLRVWKSRTMRKWNA